MGRKKKSKTEKMVQTPMYIRPEQKKALDALSEATGATTSWYVREGLDYVLKKYRKQQGATRRVKKG